MWEGKSYFKSQPGQPFSRPGFVKSQLIATQIKPCMLQKTRYALYLVLVHAAVLVIPCPRARSSLAPAKEAVDEPLDRLAAHRLL